VFRRTRLGLSERALTAEVQELLTGDRPLGLPGIVLQEVLSGIRTEKQFANLERRLLSTFTILPSNARHHVEAARLRNRCLAAGLNVSGPDCLIAVLAVAGEHQLFALDEDFQAIARHAPLKLYTSKVRD
jgi:predicted nucleic acid-binding protein